MYLFLQMEKGEKGLKHEYLFQNQNGLLLFWYIRQMQLQYIGNFDNFKIFFGDFSQS